MNFSAENARSFARDLATWAAALGGAAWTVARNIYEASDFSHVLSWEQACL